MEDGLALANAEAEAEADAVGAAILPPIAEDPPMMTIVHPPSVLGEAPGTALCEPDVPGEPDAGSFPPARRVHLRTVLTRLWPSPER